MSIQVGISTPKTLEKEEYDSDKLTGFLRKTVELLENEMQEVKVISSSIDYWKSGNKTIEGTSQSSEISLLLSEEAKDLGKYSVSCAKFNPAGMVMVVGLTNVQSP